MDHRVNALSAVETGSILVSMLAMMETWIPAMDALQSARLRRDGHAPEGIPLVEITAFPSKLR